MKKIATEVVRHKTEYEYAQNMLFPRMYSDRTRTGLRSWMGGHQRHAGALRPVRTNGNGESTDLQWENLKFFFSYQLNFMYWRYFMWNFAGRQNDIQGNGEIEHGNWITGIPFIDKLLVGDQEDAAARSEKQ